MIFLTAGGQLPFDRLAALAMACANALPEESVIYQAGPGGEAWFAQRAAPSNLTVEAFMTASSHRALLDEARWTITHAGMGSILHLLERARPMLIFPRLQRHGEHRSDHQLATAQALHKRYGLAFYTDAEALVSRLGDAPPRGDNSDTRELMERRRQSFGRRLQGVLNDWER
ncbi:glycosyltransferase [Salinicola halophilus]|uniref:glycosyltransferase n=1 Tax=Salinicola halophilus TaxID=184065 RepID=UPI0013A678E4|nr:glycosyltransferase [Salinicola halophilus]